MKQIITSLLIVWAVVAYGQSPVLHLKYDESDGSTSAIDDTGGAAFTVANQFGEPERVAGIYGNALRTDGFSTWASGTFGLDFGSQMTVETWVSLESYPSDAEVPYGSLTPSAIITQTDGSLGFELGINTFGDWWFSANINGQKYTCTAPGVFPLYTWTHVAGVVDGGAGSIKLYMNGQEVASTSIPVNGTLYESTEPLIVGKSNNDKWSGIFLLNALNAAIDETKIYDSARSGSALLADYQNGSSSVSISGFDAVAVPTDRFDHDLQRPLYHAMPPANWTNEPHGMVEYNGQYHIFYQRTPNGPFKTMMHWGHMVSSDFVNWTHLKDALWPTLEWSSTSGYDMKGIWSGDVVVENGVAHAFYTNVNHTGPYNPGIAHATSSDAYIENWTKQGPVIDREFVNDFRDPYLWKEGNTWHMIIGAAVGSTGGLDYYTSTDLSTWTHQSQFASVPYSQMDPGSGIWEMPVFEPLGNGKHILIVNPIGGSRAKYGPNYTRGVYWLGTWANGIFTPDFVQPKNLDLIHGHLSPTVARNVNGNLVGIGIVDERWSSQAQLDAGWCHTFSLPRVYSLLPDNATLGQAPAPELQSLRVAGSQTTQSNLSVSGTQPINAGGQSLEIIASVDTSTTATEYGLHFYVSDNGDEITRLYYDAVNKKIILDKSNSSLSPHDEEAVLLTADYDENAFGKPQKFHIYLDHSIIDVFINDAAAFSSRVYPTLSSSEGVELYSQGGTTNFTSLETWSLGPNGEGIAVSGISLNKTTTTVPLGEAETLVATISPANASDKRITWCSSNESIATVSSGGVITPVATGTAVITATTVDGGKSAACSVDVIPTPTYQIYDFESGDLSSWTVAGQAFSDLDVTTDSMWWGGPFDHQGNYHLWGHKDGGDAQTGEMRTTDFTLGAHGVIDMLLAGGQDINDLYVALVRSSDDQELVKITASNYEGYTRRELDGSAYVGTLCYLKVVDNSTGGFGHLNLDEVRIPIQQGSTIPVTGVSVAPMNVALRVNQTDTLIATVSPSAATNKNVTWTSGNPSVATVSNSGVVTGVAEGNATITVTTEDGNYVAQTMVTVANQDYLIYDFELGDLSGWTASGSAFVNADVTTASDWGWGGPFNPNGTYHLWSVQSGDDSQTGTLRSGNFVLDGSGIITFLIGGGFDLNTVYLALVRASDGQELMKATGDNNDSEDYTQKQFDASAYVGTTCYLKLVDNATGGWGHINLDHVVIPVNATAVSGVSVDKAGITISENDEFTLTATVSPENAADKRVTWSSSNTSVATVVNGVVTGVAAGTATVTAKTVDGGFTAQTAVTVEAQDYLVYDFETGDLSGWTASGNAFVDADVTSDLDWGWGGPFNPQGTYHLWGVKSGGDSQTGSLQSANFVLDGDGIITFLIGGGFDINTLYLALVRASDGQELMKVTGDNNDSEAYTQKQFNAGDYVGTECYLKLVDNATGGWGHINLDHVIIPVGTTPVSGVSIGGAPATLTEGASTTLTARISTADASNQNVSWSSSDTSIATVTEGIVTGVSAGNVTIIVTTADGGFSDQVTIQVKEQDYLVYDFESGDLTGWTSSGTAFTDADVTTATDWGWGGPFNPQGTHHLWSVASGSDGDTGTLKSDDFILGGDGVITFWIGGGYDYTSVYLALVRKSDGAVLMQATGDNNDSEAYTQKSFSAGAYVDTECYLMLVDNATGSWGHINLDHVVIPVKLTTGARKGASESNPVQEVSARIYPNPASDFVTVEFSDGGRARLILFQVNGKKVREIEVNPGQKIDVSDLTTGLYTGLLELRDKKYIMKLMIK